MSTDDLTRDVNAIDLPAIIAEDYPDSGARPGRAGPVKAVWRGEENPSGSVYRNASDTCWLYKDHGTGEGGNALHFLTTVKGMTDAEAAEEIKRRVGAPAANGQAKTTAKSKRGRPVAVYDYTNAQRKLIFQVVRYEPKGFAQRRPNGRGGWIWKLDGIEKVLYRLPAVLEQVQQGGAVLNVEGERDVHTLEALGLVATCNPGGAGKWEDSYSKALHGAAVVLIPDNDDKGRTHMLEAGGTKEALLELIQATPVWAPSEEVPQASQGGEVAKKSRLNLVRLCDVEPRAVEFLWEPYLIKGKLNNLQGEGGTMKTSIALDLCARLTTGRPMPHTGTPTERSNVLYFIVEDDLEDTIAPRFLAAGGDPKRFYASQGTLVMNERGEEVRGALTLDHVEEIEDALEQVRPALLVIDPVTSFLGKDVDMHRANEVRPILERLKYLAEKYAVAVLLILHIGKAGLVNPLYRALGSVDFGNTARSVLMTGKHDERMVLTHTKINVVAKGESLYYDIGLSGYTLGDRPVGCVHWGEVAHVSSVDLSSSPQPSSRGKAPSVTIEEVEEYILVALVAGPVLARKMEREIRQDLGASRHIFERARANLRKASSPIRMDYKRVGFGADGDIWWYRMDLPEPDWAQVAQ